MQKAVSKGDSLIVSGELKLYYGKPEVVAESYRIVESESRVPSSVSLDKTYTNPERYLGMLIQGKAVVIGKNQNSSGIKLEIVAADTTSNSLFVFISRSHTQLQDFSTEMLSVGDQIAIQGIMDKYTSQDSNETIYEILPRTPQDIQNIGIPQRYLSIAIWGSGLVILFVVSWILLLKKQVRSRTKEISQALETNKVLINEIHHRVKNNLAVISGLLQLESMNWSNNREVQNVLNESTLRISSIAMIHEQLYKTKDFANLSLDDYIEKLVDKISKTLSTDNKEITLKIDSNNIRLNVNQAIPCALIINELVTNAYKHGFRGFAHGELNVEMRQNGKEVNIIVGDNGRGIPEDFNIENPTSLGLSMVHQLTRQLDGKLRIKNGNGAQFEVCFKAECGSDSASNYFV